MSYKCKGGNPSHITRYIEEKYKDSVDLVRKNTDGLPEPAEWRPGIYLNKYKRNDYYPIERGTVIATFEGNKFGSRMGGEDTYAAFYVEDNDSGILVVSIDSDGKAILKTIRFVSISLRVVEVQDW